MRSFRARLLPRKRYSNNTKSSVAKTSEQLGRRNIRQNRGHPMPDEPVIPPEAPTVDESDEAPSESVALAEIVADSASIALAPDEGELMLIYMACLGDPVKVAAAANMRPEQVQAMASQKGWEAKVKLLTNIRDSQGADAVARELNRVCNLVQALRLRSLLDSVIRRVTKSRINLDRFITISKKAKDGSVSSMITMRNMVELAKAVEVAQRLTYNALGDSLGERNPQVEVASENKIGLGVLKALAAGRAVKSVPDA